MQEKNIFQDMTKEEAKEYIKNCLGNFLEGTEEVE
jgi:hypothetical protein